MNVEARMHGNSRFVAERLGEVRGAGVDRSAAKLRSAGVRLVRLRRDVRAIALLEQPNFPVSETVELLTVFPDGTFR